MPACLGAEDSRPDHAETGYAAERMSSRIEAGLTVEGSIRGEGELEVAGRVRGALTIAGKLTVEEGGIVEADVEADTIEVAGLLAGSATAHGLVQVLEGGRIEARVRAPKMLVEEGGVFRGELQSPHEENAPAKKLPAKSSRAPRAKQIEPESRSSVRGRAPKFAPPPPPAALPPTAHAALPAQKTVSREQRASAATREFPVASAKPARSASTEVPKMPKLPRGRTRIQRRGDES